MKMLDRHAYLVICHKNLNQVKLLIGLLDYEFNDIYIHIDKKATDINKEDFVGITAYSKVHVYKNYCVNWGGYSQIQVEMFLLSMAAKHDYSFYHLISGEDLPLYSPKYTYHFFEEQHGNNYIRIETKVDDASQYIDRIKYYHFFQDFIGKKGGKLIRIL